MLAVAGLAFSRRHSPMLGRTPRLNRAALLPLALLVLGLAAVPNPAAAQLARTFVSAAIGNNANDCDRLTPCRTFQAAHDKTFDQGEITVLDAGGYGALTIRKSISIINDGVGEAGVLVSGGATGITIDAPNAYVSLRGITVQGIGFGGGSGIVFSSGFALTITNCAVRNLTGYGISFIPHSANARLAVSNTLVADNGNLGIQAGGGGSVSSIKVDLDRVESRNNAVGAALFGTPGGMHASIADSVFSGNISGILVSGGGGHASTAVVMHSVISNNTNVGLQAFNAPSSLVVGQSLISGNARTFDAPNSDNVVSFGDNYIFGNFDNDPGLLVISHK
jgi:hypothetical protein